MRIDSSVDETFSHEICRLGHTCVAYKDHIIVWGGFSDNGANIRGGSTSHESKYKEPENLWLFDPIAEKWFVRKCSGHIPPGLSGASGAVIDNAMYIFGGYADTNEGHVSTLYRLDLNNYVWTLIDDAKGTPPVASDKSVSWAHDNKLYIFAGYGSPNVDTSVNHLFTRQHNLQFSRDISSVWSFRRGWNNQFVEYDPDTNQWDWPAYSGDCPTSRAAHSAAKIGDNVYIFGGRNNQKRLNDLYCLNMRQMCWRLVQSNSTLPSDQHENQQQRQHSSPIIEGVTVPCCRSWASFTPLSDTSIVLYGGFSQEEEVLDDCWLFDLDRETWHKIELPFSKPRIWHTGTRSTYDEIIILGGSSREVTSASDPPLELHEKRHYFCDEVLTLSASPRTLLRLALEQAANVDYGRERLKQLPVNLKTLLRNRKLSKKGIIISHGH